MQLLCLVNKPRFQNIYVVYSDYKTKRLFHRGKFYLHLNLKFNNIEGLRDGSTGRAHTLHTGG